MQAWHQRYIGIPYAEQNCAHLCRAVLREAFGLDVPLPTWEGDARGAVRLRESYLPQMASPVDEPRDGDVAIMCARRVGWHVGIVALLPQGLFVLHTTKPTGSVLSRTEHIRRLGFRLEGFWRWRV